MKIRTIGLGATLLLAMAAPAPAQDAAQMSFFVTSVGPGRGADLGGLAGADAHCQALATAAGAGARTWRAYLSTQGDGAVNARDRIGAGPWRNRGGAVIAQSVAQLHDSNAAGLTKATATTEAGAPVNGRGDTPNTHDILTGSTVEGRAFAGAEDRTCRNWTSSTDGSAMVGHSDRIGLRDDAESVSWNTSHPSRGCSAPQLASSGGAGLFYCFAIN
ncbi:hypothetical protein ACQW02_05275 [Humitalea sp. 24SJ18S-53]|uniref:hypothetical protein n=1 Tax=Humitalea sp. 24SJ18S-53 TaxID=3422307 RepID=UPI003D66BA37